MTPAAETKIAEAREEAPSTPPAAEISEMLKVMIESLPIKLLSPLGPELTKILQKKDEPSAAKEKAEGQKKRRMVNVMQAIERTPPSASAYRMVPAASVVAEVVVEAAAAAEAAKLASTMSGIDKLISDMVAEETIATVEENVAAVPGKGKEVVDALSEEKDFDLRNLGGQELSEVEKEELEEYRKSCGYQPGSMLFCLDSCYLCDGLEYSKVNLFSQSMLLRKALRMQQDLEDKKNEIIIEGLESKIKDYEASLEKKDFLLQATKGSLAELQAGNARLNEELLKAQTTLKEKSECFEQEKKELQAKSEAKADKNTKLQESVRDLRNKCSEFDTRCVHRLKGIFSSVGASSKEIAPSAEDISKTFEHIENEVDALDEVITGHGDLCALLASRGTAAAFLKVECTHAKTVNKPNFSLSP
jgi:DNA repair exonuclease SbcCD ATPase subunit